MKKLYLLLMLIILVVPVFSQRRYVPEKIYKQDPIICHRTDEKINVDGKCSEESWKSAKSYDFYSNSKHMYFKTEERTPYSKAFVKCMYDNENIYVNGSMIS